MSGETGEVGDVAPPAAERHPHLAGARRAGTVRVDMHMHTMWSGDATTTPEELAEAVAESGVDVLCVTDHSTINGGLRIPVRIHPRVPPGTIIGWAENLPIQYQSNEVPNVAEIKTRQEYYQIDWPVITRQRQVGVYAEEVLAVYAPFAMGVICNIANG